MTSLNSVQLNRSRSFSRSLRFLGVAAAGVLGLITASAQPVYTTPYTITTLAGDGFPGAVNDTGTAASFSNPYGIAVDSSGNVYVADTGNHLIREITPSGVTTTLATLGTGSIRGIAIDHSNTYLYVTDYFDNTIQKVAISGGAVTSFPVTGGSLNSPIGIAVDGSGNLYVADTGNYLIRKITPAGAMTTLAGSGTSNGGDGTGTGASFAYPTGVAVDGSGNVYVVDSTGDTIRKVTSGGVVTTIAGSYTIVAITDGPESGARFSRPYGIAIDAAGDLFVTDNQSLVREITAAGNVSTLAGTISAGHFNGTGSSAGFTNPTGIAVSSTGTLYIADTTNCNIREGTIAAADAPPTIQFQPQSDESVAEGSSTPVTLEVTASGSGTLTYSWKFNGNSLSDVGNISGSATNILTITGLTANEQGSYTVVVSNAYGTLTSAAATIEYAGSSSPPPVITTQPVSQTVTSGNSVTLSVVATAATNYQWLLNGNNVTGANVSGATTNSLEISDVGTDQAGSYTVVVSNANGPVTSNVATVTVNPAIGSPTFSLNPISQKVVNGTTVVFIAAATGSPTPTYQWTLNGSAIAGATGPRLVVSDATSAGIYACAASNSQGTTTSTGATLTFMSTTDVGRLINLSVNTFDGLIGTPQALTVGFVTGGVGTSGSQSLLVRADGPVLAGYGVPTGFLPDPQLTVLDGSTQVAANAGWGTPSSNVALVQAAETNTFAFAFPDSTSLDSAVVVSLPAAGYTVQVAGKSGDTGTTVAEIYDDTTQGSYTLTTPRLINLSCKLQVAANGILTEGFTVGGTTSKTVLIRASGPALTAYGVTGVMPDPQLTLFNSSNVQVAHNAGWGGDPQLTAAMTAVHAFLYTDSSSADSAILVTLPPGAYTAQGSSVAGTSGTALIEVYEVP